MNQHEAKEEIKPAIGWGTWIVLHVIAIPSVIFIGSLVSRYM